MATKPTAPILVENTAMQVAATAHAALYLRVSTGRQAESDLSIPDQRRQITGYCEAKGWNVAAEYVEPGNTATDDRRPAFQAMIEAALVKPPTFTVIVVHSFSRFFSRPVPVRVLCPQARQERRSSDFHRARSR